MQRACSPEDKKREVQALPDFSVSGPPNWEKMSKAL